MYSKDELSTWLEKYIKAHPHEEITIQKLADFSHISRYTWYRQKEIVEEIRKINATPVTVSAGDSLEFPTARQIVKGCRTEEQLIKAVQNLIDMINQLKVASSKENIKKLKDANARLSAQVKERDEMIRRLQSQVDGKILAELPSLSPREVIASMDAGSFKKQFDSLFKGIGGDDNGHRD